MFDPSTETDPEFHWDVIEVCFDFGRMKHIYVDKNSAAGFVYLRFANAQAAIVAQGALHGRWCGGKMLTATYMTPEAYAAKFPRE